MKTALEITATQSPGRIGTWSECQQKWSYIYRDGLRSPPGIALVYGRAWDKFISDPDSSFWHEKLKSGRSLSISQAQDLFVSHWDECQKECEEWGEIKPDELQKMGVKATEVWVPDFGEVYDPIIIQKHWQLGIEDGEDHFSINGVIDTVLQHRDEDEAVLHDDKTSAASWVTKTGANAGRPNRKALGSLQAPAYLIAAEHEEELKGKARTDKFIWDIQVKTKTPYFQQVEVEVDQAQKDSYLLMAKHSRREQIAAINADWFFPNRQSNLCSKRFCGYWQKCQETHGGQILD